MPLGLDLIRIVRAEESRNLPLQLFGHASKVVYGRRPSVASDTWVILQLTI